MPFPSHHAPKALGYVHLTVLQPLRTGFQSAVKVLTPRWGRARQDPAF